MFKTNHKTFIFFGILNIFFTYLAANTLILLRSEANIPPITLSHDEPKKKSGIRIGQSQQSHYTRTSNQSMQTHYQDYDTPETCGNLQRYFAWQQAIEQERLAIAIENFQKAQALEAAKTPEMRAQEAAKAEEARVIQILASKPRLTNNKQELGNYLNTLQQHGQEQHTQEPIAFDTDKTTARAKAIEATISNGGAMRNYKAEVPQHYISYLANDPDPDCKSIFSNTYGTELDLQLHKELMTTRYYTKTIESSFSQNIHVQIIGPAIHKIASDSKQERDIQKAFTLADFCADLFTCLESAFININRARHAFANGIDRTNQAIENGIVKGAQVFLSPQHWHDMATGIINIGKFLGGEISDNLDLMLSLANIDEFHRKREAHDQKNRARTVAIKNHICATLKKLKAMSWEQILEKGAEVGTIMILDFVTLSVLGNYATAAGGSLVKNAANAMRSPAASEYAVEVAGIGKVMLNKGVERTTQALETIAKEPALLEGKSVTQAISDIIKTESAVLNQSAKATIGEKSLKEVVRCTHKIARFERSLANKTGTVWNSIKMTGNFYPGTKIPKSFEIAVDKQQLWVHPNGTKHMWEYIYKAKIPSHNLPIDSQALLKSFQAALKKATKNGFEFDQLLKIDSWELKIGKPRSEGLFPTVYHAQYVPKGA